MVKKEKILGILGGMGTYAGLNFVKNFIKRWESTYKIEKEWDYPRFILDSNCKLPSRVRCIIYKEKSPLNGMIKSIKNLKNSGADMVIMPCNTAYHFLDKIRNKVDVEIIDMIELLFRYLREKKIKKINVLASEGTVMADIYGKYDGSVDIKYGENKIISRSVIEDVKKNNITKSTVKNFKRILDKKAHNVLGCTEFSLLYFENSNLFDEYKIIDTEDITIKYLVQYIKNEQQNKL